MAEHVNQWLGAYLDGELNEAMQRKVETHLATCPSCQAELAEFKGLSMLLKTAAKEKSLAPSARFSAQVALKLPRRQAAPFTSSAVRIAWWLIPAGILSAWVFLQAALVVSGLGLAAGQIGLFNGSLGWLSGLSGQNLLTSAVTGLVDGHLGQTVSSLLVYAGDGTAFGWNVVLPFAFEAGLGLLFASWLAVWWFRNSSKRSK